MRVFIKSLPALVLYATFALCVSNGKSSENAVVLIPYNPPFYEFLKTAGKEFHPALYCTYDLQVDLLKVEVIPALERLMSNAVESLARKDCTASKGELLVYLTSFEYLQYCASFVSGIKWIQDSLREDSYSTMDTWKCIRHVKNDACFLHGAAKRCLDLLKPIASKESSASFEHIVAKLDQFQKVQITIMMSCAHHYVDTRQEFIGIINSSDLRKDAFRNVTKTMQEIKLDLSQSLSQLPEKDDLVKNFLKIFEKEFLSVDKGFLRDLKKNPEPKPTFVLPGDISSTKQAIWCIIASEAFVNGHIVYHRQPSAGASADSSNVPSQKTQDLRYQAAESESASQSLKFEELKTERSDTGK